jgi:DNA-binding protein
MSEKSKIVFVGNKMPMDYVIAIMTGLSASDAKDITLKARGNNEKSLPKRPESTQNRDRNRGDAAKRRRKQSSDGFNN